MPLTWFKVKRQSVLDDPVIGILSDSAFRRYYQLTALCTELDNDGHLDETWTEGWLSWRFRISQEQIAADLKELQEAGLLDDLALIPFVNDQRRKPSDEPEATRERKRRERERQRDAPVTPPSHPVTPQEEEEEKREEEKREEKKQNREPTQKQLDAQAMFSALAEVCQIDLVTITGTQRKQLNQSELRLRKANAAPADMGPFAAWWYANDWRGKKGDAPRPAQVRETWGQFKAWREGGQTYGKRTQSTDPRAPNYRPPLIGLNA